MKVLIFAFCSLFVSALLAFAMAVETEINGPSPDWLLIPWAIASLAFGWLIERRINA